MGLYRSTAKMEKWLTRFTSMSEHKLRKMDSADLELYQGISTTEKDFNILATELFCTMSILMKLNNEDLDYVVLNLRRIVNSILKQRNKMHLVKKALSSYRPEGEEVDDIRYFLKTCKDRVKFLRGTALPENLKLTPIAEYLEIIGKETLRQDLLERFRTGHALYAMNSGQDPEGLDNYVTEIIRTVKEAGKMNAYEERLGDYIRIADEHRRKRAEEKADQDLQEKLKIAQDEMLNFQRMFNNVSFHWKTYNRIKAGPITMSARINKYGRAGKLILCCYYCKGRVVYRYVNSNLVLCPQFGSAHIYKDEPEAVADMEKLKQEHPDKVFEVVELSHIESA